MGQSLQVLSKQEWLEWWSGKIAACRNGGITVQARDENDVESKKHMSGEEFSILITPSAPQDTMYVKVEKTRKRIASSKVTEKLTKKPVQIRLNKDCSTIQISAAGSAGSVTFPKSSRKTVPNSAKNLE